MWGHYVYKGRVGDFLSKTKQIMIFFSILTDFVKVKPNKYVFLDQKAVIYYVNELKVHMYNHLKINNV